MDFGSLTLMSGLRLIAAIANQLARGEQPPEELDSYVRKSAPLRNRDALALVAEAEYRWRRNRERYFRSELFGEAPWDILLDLYINEVRSKSISVTSACLASNVPPTTALRYIQELEQDGLVVREEDKRDLRRRYLKLSSSGRNKLEAYLAAQMGSSDRADAWMFPRPISERSAHDAAIGNSA